MSLFSHNFLEQDVLVYFAHKCYKSLYLICGYTLLMLDY